MNFRDHLESVRTEDGAILSPLSVVELERHDRLSNNLSLWVGLIENRLILDEYE